ncbi:DMT family transporter [Permianibacter aggregans]|uniref:EamA domain-containing membrane protein RarD n=1 Tax=Permianibacter aggregans TaxID=1510150 RepID=A0A4R6UT89_9GAMM|nr:DMT family transporter [Permianibacter aggregans]TDQ50371.1 EamA domain-containing membrane protein RarD [Permianibacter aggregans]
MNPAIIRGATLLVLSELIFSLLAALVKHLSEDYSNAQVVFLRNFVALLVLLPYLKWRGRLHFRINRIGFHLLRSTTGISSMYLYFFCLGVLPLGETTLLIQTSPIWIPVIAYFWLKEEFKKSYLFAGLFGLLGVALVVRPTPSDFSPVVLLALLGAMLGAGSRVTIRKMASTETSNSIVLYFSLISSVITAVPAVLDWHPIARSDWPLLLALGLTAAAGQLLMTKAFMLAPSGRIGFWSYTQVVFAFLLGFLFWQETVHPMSIAGAICIVIAGLISTGYVSLWIQRLRHKSG